MKNKYLLVLLYLFFSLSISAQNQRSVPVLFLDYQYEYSWDSNNGDWSEAGLWSNPNRIDAIYNELGNLIEQLVFNSITNENVRRTLYTYDQKGNLLTITEQYWLDTSWNNLRLIQYSYSELNQIFELIIELWAEKWINLIRRYDYEYNTQGLLTKYTQQVWQDNIWADATFVIWSYETSGLSERLITDIQNDFESRYIYLFDGIEKTNTYTYQIWNASSWLDRVKRTTYYNDCGYKKSQIRQHFIGDEWDNILKTDYYYVFESEYKKIPICHNGKTIWISKNAMPTHINHGDCLGECENGNISSKKSSRKSVSDNFLINEKIIQHDLDDFLNHDNAALKFDSNYGKESFLISDNSITLYPNPISHQQLKVRFDDNNIYTKMDLLDLSGRLLHSYNVAFQSEYSLGLNGLRKGTYFLKFQGEKFAIEKVIVK